MNPSPAAIRLKGGVPATFQMSYEGVDKDIATLDTVLLGVTNLPQRSVTFYNNPIESR